MPFIAGAMSSGARVEYSIFGTSNGGAVTAAAVVIVVAFVIIGLLFVVAFVLFLVPLLYTDTSRFGERAMDLAILNELCRFSCRGRPLARRIF